MVSTVCRVVLVIVMCGSLCQSTMANEPPTFETIQAAFAHQNTGTVDCTFTRNHGDAILGVATGQL